MRIQSYLLFAFLIFSITIAIYSTSFFNGFVYDDYFYIADNTAIRECSFDRIFDFFVDRDTTSADKDLSRDIWRPLTTLSYAVDYKLWRLDPRFFHIENVIIHSFNALLVYVLLVIILGNGFTAFIAAIVFAIHPVQTEAVVWASGRPNLLFLFFFLLAVIFHIRDVRSNLPGMNYAASLALFCLSLLSKEMAITLPLLLIIFDLTFIKKRSAVYYIKYYAPYLIVAVFYMLARSAALGVFAQRQTWWADTMPQNVYLMFRVLVEYIRLVIMPVKLKVMYMFSAPSSIADFRIPLVSLAVFALASIIFTLRKNKTITFFIWWFLLSLLPVSNIIPFKALLGERFLYLPLIGFAAIFGIVFSASEYIFRKTPWVKVSVTMLFITIIIVYCFMAVSRIADWNNQTILYLTEITRSPGSPKSHVGLAYSYSMTADGGRETDVDAMAYRLLAVKEYNEAARLSPLTRYPYIGLGYVYSKMGQDDLAIKNLRKGLCLYDDIGGYNNLAVSYYRKGQYDKSIEACKKALAMDSLHLNSTINLGNAYFSKGDFTKARKSWERAMALGTKDKNIFDNVSDLKRLGY